MEQGATKREWSEPGGSASAVRRHWPVRARSFTADDLEIDWDRPSYDEQCKYTFFQGRLRDHMTAPTAIFTEYKQVHPNDATA